MEVECPHCHIVLKVADQHVGKRGRCSSCKNVIPLVPRVQIELESETAPRAAVASAVGVPTSAAPARTVAAPATALAGPPRQFARGDYPITLGLARPPRGAKACTLTGKTEVRFMPPHVQVGGLLHQPGKTALQAAGLTVVTFVVVYAVAQATGWAAGPGFLLWYAILDKVHSYDEQFRLDPRRLRAHFDPKNRRFRLEMTDGTWVCGLLKKTRDISPAAFQHHLHDAYGDNLMVTSISKFGLAQKIVLFVFLGLILLVLIAAIVVAATA